MNNLYETMPKEISVSEELRSKVLEYLQSKPNSWSTVKQICEAVGFDEKDRTKPTIRKACKELLHYDNMPIASCNSGFTYATHKNILLRYKEDMESRVKGMMRTIKDLDRVISGGGLSEGFLAGDLCMGVHDNHLWDKNKDPWVCIRCRGERRG